MKPGGELVGLVLAAGLGSRFGATKQVAPVAGRPLLRLTIESLLDRGLAEVVVVLGHDAARVREVLRGLPVSILLNDRFAEGMASSIAAGIASLGPDTAGALVALGDQPVPPAVVERLIERWAADECDIVAPLYDGTRGNPVLFGAALFPELTRLSGDRGARDLLDASPARTTFVDFDFEAPPDVDRPEDVAAVRERCHSGSADPGSADSRQSDRPRLL